MRFLSALVQFLLLPGTLVLNALGVSVENDGGIFRSLINMIVWGFIAFLCVLPFMAG